MDHCPEHGDTRDKLIAVQTKVGTMEANIIDLYEKKDELRDLLNGISKEIAEFRIELKIFISRADERVKMGDKFRSDYVEEIKGINERLAEYDRFAWFRNAMNKIRDNFLVLVFGGIILTIAGIASAWSKIKHYLY